MIPDSRSSRDAIFETRCEFRTFISETKRRNQKKTKCTISVKQLGPIEQAGEITCSEWLTAAQLKLCGITDRDVETEEEITEF
jgi:hypothetical protein